MVRPLGNGDGLPLESGLGVAERQLAWPWMRTGRVRLAGRSPLVLCLGRGGQGQRQLPGARLAARKVVYLGIVAAGGAAWHKGCLSPMAGPRSHRDVEWAADRWVGHKGRVIELPAR